MSGVKIDVAGGSSCSVVLTAALRTVAGASGLRLECRDHAVRAVAHVVELGDVEAATPRQPGEHFVALARLPEHVGQVGDQGLAFAGGDHVGEQGQRLGVHERHGAADHDQRIAGIPRRGPRRQSGQPQHRDTLT